MSFNQYLNLKNKRTGFTLIEVLMVILLLAILALIGITQFTNFSADAKNNATKANLQVLRRGIATQNAQMRVRCGTISATWPPLANLTANDITSGGAPCTTTQVATSSDRAFVATAIPVNPWGTNQSNTILQCVGAGCTNRALQCAAAIARTGTEDGWCYNVNTGDIWANTMRNDGVGTGGTEYTY